MAKKKKPEDELPPITLEARGADSDRDNQVNEIKARNSPAFPFVLRLLADALDRRAEIVLLDYTAQAVAVRYQIDGLWLNSATLDRPTGDVMLAVLKTLANKNIMDRRSRQQGEFLAKYKKQKYTCTITSQGVQTGERVTVLFDSPAFVKPKLIADLGMREKIQEQIKELYNLPKGFILVSAPPGAGFTTLFATLLRSSDRFVRNFAEVQDVQKADKPVENVPLTSFDSGKGETALDVLPKLIRTYPDVLVFRDLINAATLEALVDQVDLDRLIVGGIRAKEAAEALLRVQALGAPRDKFPPVANASINGRLVRRLCDNCKVPYAPPPQVLHQLGIPQGKVAAFFRPWEGPLPPKTEKEEPKLCENCAGLGYRGRIGIYELLVLNDSLRELLARNPSLDAFRNEARKAGMRTLQEEGIVLVAKGVTSLPELLRVLKE